MIICQRCHEGEAQYRVLSDVIDTPVCPRCALLAFDLPSLEVVRIKSPKKPAEVDPPIN